MNDDNEHKYFLLEVLGITSINEDEEIHKTKEDKFINNLIIAIIVTVILFISMIISYT